MAKDSRPLLGALALPKAYPPVPPHTHTQKIISAVTLSKHIMMLGLDGVRYCKVLFLQCYFVTSSFVLQSFLSFQRRHGGVHIRQEIIVSTQYLRH